MTTTTHLEVEEKYEADESLRLPALLDLASVARVGRPLEFTLEASYYDTADLRLIARGITLRRRTGGEDAGWHLKLPLGGGDRLEIHRPLGRSRRAHPPVPQPLLRLVRAHVRDAEVSPIVRLTTRRIVQRLYGTGDSLLAEIADDHVSAEVLGDDPSGTAWRELEVELVDGDRDLLAAVGALLTKAGARPATAASKLARSLGKRLPPGVADRPHSWPKRSAAGAAVLAYLHDNVEALLAADPAVREERADSVHKMRVATLRMCSALASYRPLFDPAVTEPLRAQLKWLGGLLGAVRDAEVMHAHLMAALGELPEDEVLGPVRPRIDNDLQGSYLAARQRLLSELDGVRYFRLLDDLDALIRSPPLTSLAGQPATKVLPRRVASERRRLRARRDGSLHDVGKASERARYAAEVAAPAVGRPAERFADAMTELQETLAVHQDTVLTRSALRRMGAQAHLAGENGFTFGVLHGLQIARGDRAERDFRAAQLRR